ncbi:GCN5-like N-acetyltransferase [Achromobacter arsenitoxydans SY8]|uniref:GCN5-like N-acetyltransferase n=2 Tax=Achromobacter TaxID=222 RepID=H0FCB5_9BURK|nr:GCN5-like N-acetyltransferase [Achromobacter arsenitoxydans SY8]
MQTMTTPPQFVPTGYSDVPPGHIASVVTDLEMLSRPVAADTSLPAGFTLAPVADIGLDAYRSLFRKVGADWLWFSRLFMADDDLAATLADPNVEVHIVRSSREDVGILELDFRQTGQCELTFLGLTADCTGIGLGRALMSKAIALAWARPIKRLWVHTCTYDHPSALRFYINAGFKPYAVRVEVQIDPRLTGHLPRDAAPQVPIIG